ncbi:UNVERIFIED_CONTAM: hypothetical protein K2H54_022439 [Gekko kuhli]
MSVRSLLFTPGPSPLCRCPRNTEVSEMGGQEVVSPFGSLLPTTITLLPGADVSPNNYPPRFQLLVPFYPCTHLFVPPLFPFECVADSLESYLSPPLIHWLS